MKTVPGSKVTPKAGGHGSDRKNGPCGFGLSPSTLKATSLGLWSYTFRNDTHVIQQRVSCWIHLRKFSKCFIPHKANFMSILHQKRQKKFGKQTPRKKALVQPAPFLSDTHRVGQNDHLYRCFPGGIQTHQGSQNLLLLPFHQVF